MERNHLSEEEAARRLRSQLTNQQRADAANVVLSTLWEPEVTQRQVRGQRGERSTGASLVSPAGFSSFHEILRVFVFVFFLRNVIKLFASINISSLHRSPLLDEMIPLCRTFLINQSVS